MTEPNNLAAASLAVSSFVAPGAEKDLGTMLMLQKIVQNIRNGQQLTANGPLNNWFRVDDPKEGTYLVKNTDEPGQYDYAVDTDNADYYAGTRNERSVDTQIARVSAELVEAGYSVPLQVATNGLLNTICNNQPEMSAVRNTFKAGEDGKYWMHTSPGSMVGGTHYPRRSAYRRSDRQNRFKRFIDRVFNVPDPVIETAAVGGMSRWIGDGNLRLAIKVSTSVLPQPGAAG